MYLGHKVTLLLLVEVDGVQSLPFGISIMEVLWQYKDCNVNRDFGRKLASELQVCMHLYIKMTFLVQGVDLCSPFTYNLLTLLFVYPLSDISPTWSSTS